MKYFNGYVSDDGKKIGTYEEVDKYEHDKDFYEWCDLEFRGGEFTSDMIARALLEAWEVKRRVREAPDVPTNVGVLTDTYAGPDD